MQTKAEQLEELKATAVKLQRQIWALEKPEKPEKPKQWKPTVGLDWVDRAHISTYTLLLKYVKEFGGDWEADWGDNHPYNYCVQYSNLFNTWCVNYNYTARCTSGTIYMSKDCADGLVVKLNSGEVVL